MRTGLTVSLIGHALLIAWGLFELPGTKPFDAAAIDALPVDLIPIGDVTNLSEGKKTAPKGDTASQGKAKPPIPQPDSKKIGNAPKDLDAPATDKASETAAAKEATPPPPPKAPAKPPEPAPEPPKPEKPQPEPPKQEPAKPEPAKTELAKADTGEIVAPDKQPDKPEEAPKAPPAPRLPPSKPKPPPPTPQQVDKPTQADKPQKTDKSQKTADKSDNFDPNQLAALLNKIDPSGGGGKASDKEASLGSENATGAVANMSQSELDALTAAVQACFNPPVGAAGIENIVVPLVVEFTPDGDLAGPPRVKAIPDGPAGQAVADAAVRAVQRCAPYPFLPKDKYQTWRVVNMNFSPPSSY